MSLATWVFAICALVLWALAGALIWFVVTHAPL